MLWLDYVQLLNDKGNQIVWFIGINNLTHKHLTKIKVIVKHFSIQLEIVFPV